MKKMISLLLLLCLTVSIAVPAAGTPEEPVITMQPQSHNYPEYSVAVYTVKATGTNLSATWYIEYQGKTYNASQIGGAMQPWEAYAGESYGAKKVDDQTFSFIFEGIEAELDGAEIWCEIEDGHYDVVSQVGHITVGNYGAPPEILSIPASVTVQQDQEAEIRCVARSTDGSQLNFLWYETGTGKFEDMQAIDRGAETGDFMLCDTRTVGTRYYVCGITTTGGGIAYSSMVEVNVLPVTEETEPEETTPAETEPSAPLREEPEPSAPAVTDGTEPIATTAPEAKANTGDPSEKITWWVLLPVGLGAAGAGVVTTVLLSRKKKG